VHYAVLIALERRGLIALAMHSDGDDGQRCRSVEASSERRDI